MLDMVLGRLIAMANGLLRVTMGDERLMRRMRIVLLGVESGCFAMMRRGLLMMCRRRIVMLGARKCFVHDILRYSCCSGGARWPRVPAVVSGKVYEECRRSRRQQAQQKSGDARPRQSAIGFSELRRL